MRGGTPRLLCCPHTARALSEAESHRHVEREADAHRFLDAPAPARTTLDPSHLGRGAFSEGCVRHDPCPPHSAAFLTQVGGGRRCTHTCTIVSEAGRGPVSGSTGVSRACFPLHRPPCRTRPWGLSREGRAPSLSLGLSGSLCISLCVHGSSTALPPFCRLCTTFSGSAVRARVGRQARPHRERSARVQPSMQIQRVSGSCPDASLRALCALRCVMVASRARVSPATGGCPPSALPVEILWVRVGICVSVRAARSLATAEMGTAHGWVQTAIHLLLNVAAAAAATTWVRACDA